MKLALPFSFILHAVPALAAVFVFDAYPSWIIAALVLPLFIWSVWRVAGRAIASVISALSGLGSIMLLTALHLQGEGFNDRYFYHFNLESLKIGLDAYPELVYGATAVVGLCALYPWFFKANHDAPARVQKPGRWAAILGLVTVASFPPVLSSISYAKDSYEQAQNPVRIMRQTRELEIRPLESLPKNLVLIYAESLEQTFFDETIFPGLMPGLSKLREESLRFTNVEQVDGTGWTIAGIVASQCSLPFNVQYWDGQEAHAGLAAIEAPFEQEICMGDILDGYGYENVFMGGAELSFAGKGKFLTANGYDQALGFSELIFEQEDTSYRSGWGLYDDSLLVRAQEKLVDLTRAEAPYMLSVLTVDTHQPAGHISKDCTPYPVEDNAILHAVHCSDQVLSAFISDLRARPEMENTVIALFSDHLALRNTAFDRLKANADKRRLAWMVWGADIEAGENDARATHFDVGPTLMELLGIPNYHVNNFGHSILDGRNGFWFDADADTKDLAGDIDYLDMGDNRASQGVRMDSVEREIWIGEKAFKASRAGFDLGESAVFTLLIKADGTLDAVLFAEDMEKFYQIADNQLVVAMSRNPALADVGNRVDIDTTEARAQAETAEEDASSASDTPDAPLATPPEPLPAVYYYVGSPSRKIGDSGELRGDLVLAPRYMRKKLKLARKRRR